MQSKKLFYFCPPVTISMFQFIRNTIISTIDWAYQPFKKIIPRETFRYAATGGFNTALDILLYFVFYHYILSKQIVDFGFVAISPHIAAFIFVFPITFISGFLFAKHITFTASPIRGRVQLFRYALTVAGSIFLNYILLKFFVEYLLIWPTISKIITTVFVVTYSYMVQRYYTFKTGTVGKQK
jgi:putative flippase GtrA